MGQPWAAGSADGAPARLPLVLTALWAAAVGLELAYVLVLGPGPPPLGPLARALQLALAAFQLLNLLGNVGLFLRSDPSIRGVMLAGRGLGQGWAYCYQCQSQVPPRSGHCSACRVCILRRDHHCRLLGRCVGFGNYRPFLCLLLHAAGVLLHISVLLGPALSALLRAHTPLHMAALLLLPWLMLLTGRVSLAQFALAFVTDTCVAGALLCGAGLLFHGMLLLRGQTTWEWARGQHSYDLGPCHNLQAALGPRWALVWLWPFLASPLPGDGITFQTTADVGHTAS
ncbi:probable palmitoyltransferase ZDHHC24 isoform X2 [Macaca nemestrina]|uniref:Palmitoyltransferase n=4 Tax=Cercopithecinae TaxID=9528 RepID=H9ESD7_MACMU|nr:probable palmitoyltransferase ZDHHC24 [Macaca mulatta]XP_005577207.1 probable palmitoyltransferase ZDHHC24 isoform X2 [Macaca fascicularis]XP_007972016.1 probable palmitoyltransferase ZDHHC24 isoform X2 [Chlorocebus sabaeus]XP_011719250.1 probable palmitoyltransferase ZDHHC24 [Macaca nemestrina]XP_050612717.1 probable palmitoyltransferase ZDHHC24 isoform X2 [Macaca thibetana thibetana]